jgi:hypothetical protein
MLTKPELVALAQIILHALPDHEYLDEIDDAVLQLNQQAQMAVDLADTNRLLDDANAMIRAENERLRAAQEWVKVSDRLPTFDDCIHGKVLCLFANGVMDTWNPILIETHLKGEMGLKVTHWKPLPEPPKE